MRQQSPLMLGLAMLVFAAGTMIVADPASGEEYSKVEMAAAVTVTIHDAIKTASEKVPGTVIEAELDRKHGKLIWEVEVVTAEHRIMEVHIDAETGTFIDIEEEKARSGRLKRPRS